jgi:hypothetical protein
MIMHHGMARSMVLIDPFRRIEVDYDKRPVVSQYSRQGKHGALFIMEMGEAGKADDNVA